MKRWLCFLLTVLLCLGVFCGCSGPDADNTGSAQNSTESETIDLSEKPDETYPEMELEEGYFVISSEILTIPVTENKVKVERTARVAALRNASGENALYFDVLSADHQILSHMLWKGYYQLFIDTDGILILMQIQNYPSLQRGRAIRQCYVVSDTKLVDYDVVELDHPQIHAVAGESSAIDLIYGRPYLSEKNEIPFLDFASRFREEIEPGMNEAREVYMLADGYLNPEEPRVYSNESKAPVPDFREKAIADKYTWAYVYDLLT